MQKNHNINHEKYVNKQQEKIKKHHSHEYNESINQINIIININNRSKS